MAIKRGEARFLIFFFKFPSLNSGLSPRTGEKEFRFTFFIFLFYLYKIKKIYCLICLDNAGLITFLLFYYIFISNFYNYFLLFKILFFIRRNELIKKV